MRGARMMLARMTRVRMTPASSVALVVVLCFAALTAGCVQGPNYKRPATNAPDTFRDVAAAPTGAAGAAAPAAGATGAASAAPSIGDAKWWDVFQDEQLQSLIKTGLAQNFNVRIAATRILQAEAQLGITRSAQYPQASAGVTGLGERTRQAGVNNGNPVQLGVAQVQGTLAWELDFWGKFRRATEGSQAQLLATQWGQRAVVTTLVSQIASAYFDLRALDLQLEISKRTLDSRQESLRLTQVRERGGATSLVDVRQAEQLVYTATSEIAALEREIAQQENFISVLLGNNPSPVTRGRALSEQPHAADVPAGLPSSLLERRPDIQQTEQLLVAANANIGVARAAYFPQITLTGNGGFQSTALSTLFTGAAGVWSVAAALSQPIFTAGRTRSQVALAEAREQELVLTYQQAIKQAFREVSDALIGYRKTREFREQQGLLVGSAQDARRLAQLRYEGGATSYLEVLDADTRLFSAELGFAQAQSNELASLVEIYRALGGGWQP
jgi:multidrug efflux system outer membrane protein